MRITGIAGVPPARDSPARVAGGNNGISCQLLQILHQFQPPNRELLVGNLKLPGTVFALSARYEPSSAG